MLFGRMGVTQIELGNIQEAFVIAFAFPVELSLALVAIMFLYISVIVLFTPPKREKK